MTNVEIIPAVMPRSFMELREYVEQAKGLVPLMQIDVMDGIFVPEKSWPYTEGDYEGFMRLVEGNENLEEWAEMDFEADLMIANPDTEIDKWIRAGARRIVVHGESPHVFGEIFSRFKDRAHERHEGDYFDKPLEIGVALDIDTPNELLSHWIRDIDFAQFMGIARIGFQGQPFDERVLEKIRSFHTEYPGVTISVDGGVSLATAPRLVEAGATRLVAGSANLEGGDN